VESGVRYATLPRYYLRYATPDVRLSDQISEQFTSRCAGKPTLRLRLRRERGWWSWLLLAYLPTYLYCSPH
jgi:hypothetical protein